MNKSDNSQRVTFRENAIHVGAGFVMMHITEPRSMGNHADMGQPRPAASRKTAKTARIRRRGSRNELAAAQSTWESEGGTTARQPTDRDSETNAEDASTHAPASWSCSLSPGWR